MSAVAVPQPAQIERVDTAALRLMLDYVEAECRRIGALDAALHAALAAVLVERPAAFSAPSGALGLAN
jgi:ABC-type transporter Mla MlaB component